MKQQQTRILLSRISRSLFSIFSGEKKIEITRADAISRDTSIHHTHWQSFFEKTLCIDFFTIRRNGDIIVPKHCTVLDSSHLHYPSPYSTIVSRCWSRAIPLLGWWRITALGSSPGSTTGRKRPPVESDPMAGLRRRPPCGPGRSSRSRWRTVLP